MPEVNRGNRPLSPHMSIYRPQITSISSILTRITGNALVLAGLMVTWWFVALATSPEAFDTADAVLTSWFGKLVFLGSIWALWYHTLAGIRHLIWDQVALMEIKTAEMLGWACIVGATVLTLLTIVIL
ncbi:succinate dehydrogenase, cytochrome b556 subunit [Jannaschia sp. Os4]|uniref:succinate dehydrogenase, cytochrome b556 subunit n=1 Tax=Jannaschia sp. Os4 TaxID=2807617 RepID=UPI00193A62FA|nr:succinate dehydrogenase, cytochrome b556 subunit [Jannaschia sp. Os4]MBM2575762.1 succinate dehydrogenase, cytochrome b556 subunit [Jannaschia sp. Os4]